MAKKVEEEVQVLTPWQLREMQIRMRNYSPDASECYQCGYQSRGIYKPDEVSAAFPVNPMTGNAMGDLTRVMSSVVSPREKEEIMSRLKQVDGTYVSLKDLSDADIFALIPPRYIGEDPVDVQHWRDYLSHQVFPEMSKDIDKLLAPPVNPDVAPEAAPTLEE